MQHDPGKVLLGVGDMNAVAVIEAVAIVAPMDAWIETGRALAARRRDVDWEIADWMVAGQAQGYIDQAGFDFLSCSLGIAPKRLKDIAKAAIAFPVHLRDSALSIEHHAHVADLPRGEQMELLSQAKREHWSDDDLRKQAITHKVGHGHVSMLSQDEWDEHCRMALQHAWNRASPTVREDFAEQIKESHLGVIDA